MTSSKLSESDSDETCKVCGGPMTYRPAHPYPVLLHVAFGLSFVVFLLLFDRIRGHRSLAWAWSIGQMALGTLLIRARMRAKKRVLRCIRCSSDLR